MYYIVYGFCNGNANITERQCRVCFSNWRDRRGNVFQRLDQCLSQTGLIVPRNANVGRPRQRYIVQLEEQVLYASQ